MNPPEIYLKFPPSFRGEFIDCEASKIDRDGFEKYVPAPVWLDAVKDPPKKTGFYLIAWSDEPDFWERGFWNVSCWEGKDWKRPLRKDPDYYCEVQRLPRKGDLK